MTNIKLAKNTFQNAVGYTVKYGIMNNPRPQSTTYYEAMAHAYDHADGEKKCV
jgi:hypothetical protein